MSLSALQHSTALSLLCNNSRAPPRLLQHERCHEDDPLDGCGDEPRAGKSCGHAETGGSAQRLHEETRALIRDFYRARAGMMSARTAKQPAARTMSRVVEQVVCKHRLAYNGMLQRLCVEQQDDELVCVRTVAEQLFSEGCCNWGRVVSLLAFGAVLCARLKEVGREHCIDTVALHISSYLTTHQYDWLINNRAWEGFVEFFQVEDPESAVRNTLMALAGLASLAGFVLLIR